MNNAEQFERQVSAAISANQLLRPGARVVVALSGGADSVALLAVLAQLGYDCVAAHCNFRLRGEESMRDMRHAEAVCRRLGVELTTKYFDVEGRRKLTGESVEMACRTLRYNWFAQLLDSKRAAAIAVGHHREDNVETFMLNLLRGTGMAGLCGMRYRNGMVIRPLLDMSRSDIEAYLQACGLTYIVDSSNNSDEFKRNRLRNRVLPELQRSFPGAADSILATIRHLAGSHSLYRQLVADRMALYADDCRTVSLDALAASEPGARMLLFEFLHDEGYNMSVIAGMIGSVGQSGKLFRSKTGVVRELSRGKLKLQNLDATHNERIYPVSLLRDILSPVHIEVNEADVAEFKPCGDVNVAYFDAAIAAGDDLCLRHWRRGDRLDPFGMQGSKLVSDLFAGAKYDAAAKRDAWLLCKGDTILWVVGLRASRHYAVGPGTCRFITLRACPAERANGRL